MTTKLVETDQSAITQGGSEPQPPEMRSRPLTAEVILSWLVAKISGNLGIDPTCVDGDQPLAAYALGSVQSVSLVADLEDFVGQKLPPTLLWDYPTLRDVAGFLVENSVN